jgi:hypothetical protein
VKARKDILKITLAVGIVTKCRRLLPYKKQESFVFEDIFIEVTLNN